MHKNNKSKWTIYYVGEGCPVCNTWEKGTLVKRKSKFGVFLGCSRYPQCTWTARKFKELPTQPLKEKELSGNQKIIRANIERIHAMIEEIQQQNAHLRSI